VPLLIAGWLKEYCSASSPAFSMPIVAELPSSMPSLSIPWYRKVMWPVSVRTTSKLTRLEVSARKATLSHSITKLRSGAEPSASVRTLAAPSTMKSSQNG
jgi:hypothetical protein